MVLVKGLTHDSVTDHLFRLKLETPDQAISIAEPKVFYLRQAHATSAFNLHQDDRKAFV